MDPTPPAPAARPAVRYAAWLAAWLAPLVLPAIWLLGARGAVLGVGSMDLVGHLSTVYHASLGEPFRTTMIAWPAGADLMAIVGGWLDILLAAPLVGPIGVGAAYNLVFALYAALAGYGGTVLARALGASPGPAAMAGLLLQLDGFVLRTLTEGRPEQGALGLVALAVAGAVATWRRPGHWAVLGTGLVGALVVYASWELALFLGFALPVLALGIWAGERARGAALRWALAVLVAVILASPWVWLFLQHAGPVRALDEGRGALQDARIASVSLLGWLGDPHAPNPPVLALLAMLALPWTARPRDRRLWLAVGVVLAAALALGFGPSPGLRVPGDLPALAGRGPFRLLLDLPFLGWFHTPDRLLCAWDLAAPVAAALALERLRGRPRGRWWVALAAAAFVGSAAVETRWGGFWPRGGYRIPDHPGLTALASLPGREPVLDLPPHTHRIRVMQYQAMQLAHHRPIPYHMTNPALTTDTLTPLLETEPFFAWYREAERGDAPEEPVDPELLRSLRRKGFRFLVLNPPLLPPATRSRTVMALRAGLGRPTWMDEDRWLCWELPEG